MKTTLIIALTVTLNGACAYEEDVPTGSDGEPIPQGLTIFTETAAEGLTAMYAKGKDVVFLETVRMVETEPGPVHQSWLADGTPVNISVRFTDSEGRNLVTSASGDEVPAHWAHRAPHGRPDEGARRPILGALIAEAAASLPDAGIAADMQPEVERVVRVGKYVPQAAPEHVAPETPPEMLTWEPEGWFYQIFEVRKKWIGWPIAEHSATQWWNCEGGGLGCYGYQETDNHGESASTMNLKCDNVSPWRYDAYMTVDSVGKCGTAYSTCSQNYGSHNCHDDTKVQLKRILCGYTPSGVCTNPGCDTKAPGYCGC